MQIDFVASLLGIDGLVVRSLVQGFAIDTLITAELATGVTPKRAGELQKLTRSHEVRERCCVAIDAPICAELREGVTLARVRELFRLARSDETKAAIARHLVDAHH